MKKIYNIEFNNGNYVIIGCSVKGTGKEVNQDSFLIDANEKCVMCFLADGLGSAINSEIGSETVCRIAGDIIAEQGLTDEFPFTLKKRWVEALQVKPISADSTFKFLVIKPDEIIYGGIGDGWVIGIADGQYFEYKTVNSFSNQTDSMLSVGYEEKFKVISRKFHKLQVVSLATDGFSEDIEGAQVQSFIKDCLSEIEHDSEKFATELENMMGNWPIKTNQDDKSIILVGGANE